MCYVLWMLTSHNATGLEASAEPMFASSAGIPKPEGLLCKNNVTNSSLSICKGFLNSRSQIFSDPSDMLFNFHNSIFQCLCLVKQPTTLERVCRHSLLLSPVCCHLFIRVVAQPTSLIGELGSQLKRCSS